MLTPETFRELLADRRRIGASLAAIGRELGVSRQAVHQYLAGQDPSDTVLLLAEYVWGRYAGDWPMDGAGNLSGQGR